jgi:hypothetical protein
MFIGKVVRCTVALLVCLLALPFVASAQQGSGIAGAVRDDTGGVLPGVTVEVTSPALIEGSRVAFSNGEGRYAFIDLVPGAYAVTFTLPGFSTIIREGVELTSGFTAQINADMQVGGIEETITVTGASPLVDVQNVRAQNVVSSELLATLPSNNKSMAMLANVTPGMVGNPDVGGSAGAYSQQAQVAGFHGKTNSNKYTYDGMTVSNMCGVASVSYIITGSMLEEMVVEISGFSAEGSTSSVNMNAVPKSGGNTFSGSLNGMFANDKMQSSNLGQKLIDRGLSTGFDINAIYHGEGTLGGPVAQDKLWFFTAHRWTGSRNQIAGVFWNKTQGTPVYTPDLDRQSDQIERLRSNAFRLTWQASTAHKLSGFIDVQDNYMPRHRRQRGFQAPEALNAWDFPPPSGLYQMTWTGAVSNRLLLEAGMSTMLQRWNVSPQTGEGTGGGGVGPTDIAIRELTTGFTYNAARGGGPYGDRKTDRNAQRFSVSYVTGSHNFKTGFKVEQGLDERGSYHNGGIPMEYGFRNGLPSRLTLYTTPAIADHQAYDLGKKVKADMAIFAQDQWTLNRLSINYGIRMDYFNGESSAKNVPATSLVQARKFAAIPNVPNWTDISPRAGIAYDVAGNGTTAIKFSMGKYVVGNNAQYSQDVNPLRTSVASVNRSWTDANGDFIPDCDLKNPLANGECGKYSNPDFGGLRITTEFDDRVVTGFGTRDYLWDTALEIQHELMPGVSVTGGYYHNWYANFVTRDNRAVTSADYDPYCITAPTDSRLPGGGGYEVCGLYDISEAKYGKKDIYVTRAADFGDRTRVSDFFGLNVDGRFDSGFVMGGGIDVGRTVDDACYTVDVPNQAPESRGTYFGLNSSEFCRQEQPFKANLQVKLHGSYPLPGDISLAAVFQSVSGPTYNANYSASNAEISPSLGRNLSGNRNSTTVPLIAPWTLYEGRRNQLDLRVSKALNFGGTLLRLNFDAFNALNSDAILGANPNFGASWRRPQPVQTNSAILDARLFEVSADVTF